MATRLTIIGLLLTGAMALPAAAHETPRGPQAPASGLLVPLAPDGTNGSSLNMSLVANLPQAGPAGDIAFWGDEAFVSFGSDDADPNNDGFRVVDISRPRRPRVVSSFTCPRTGYDIGVWEDLVFLSVNHATPRSCDPQDTTGEHFTGIAIVSVEHPRKPRLVATVPTCGFSHTNTVVPDEANGRVLVYATGPCVDVVEVPLERPADARALGAIPGAPGCHDITVLLERDLAAAACSDNGVQLWDISDRAAPTIISEFRAPIHHHHSVVFSKDGRSLALSEEQLEGFLADVCYADTARARGALWFYDVTDPRLPVPKGFLQIDHPRPSGYCSAHQANLVPRADDRDVLVMGWYRGGALAVDFTDLENPRQIAHFTVDRPGLDQDSNVWSAYFYRGYVYATNSYIDGELLGLPARIPSRRGLDVLRIDHAAFEGALDLPHLNAQTQEPY